jgi:hypothetical protein
MKYALWTAQILLALVFLFTGGLKLVLPDAAIAEQFPFPVLFIRCIAVAELAGAAGLILPGLLKVRTELTPWAAAGLAVIMVGATIVTALTMGVLMALFPLIVGVLSAFVAWGRWTTTPLAARTADRERDLVRNR